MAAMIPKPCLDCGVPFAPRFRTVPRCPACERAWNAKRNARPERGIYKGTWPAESKAIRNAEPWCHAKDVGLEACAVTGVKALTVDHPTRKPLCRHHHQTLEEQRKKADRYVAVAERPASETFAAQREGPRRKARPAVVAR